MLDQTHGMKSALLLGDGLQIRCAGNELNIERRFAMLARIILAITLVLVSVTTYARDDGRYSQVAPDIKRWVEGLTDDKGRGCCATADGFRPEEVDWDMTENNYKVMIGGQWYTVPEGAVVKESNRIGYAIVWYYVDNGALFIRCFLPGSGA